MELTKYDFSKTNKIKDALLAKCLKRLKESKNIPVSGKGSHDMILKEDDLEMVAAAGNNGSVKGVSYSPYPIDCPYPMIDSCRKCKYYSGTTAPDQKCIKGYKKE